MAVDRGYYTTTTWDSSGDTVWVPATPESPRKRVLDAASKAVLKDRNDTHGEPEDTFAAIADFHRVWRKWNRHRNGDEHDTAIELLLVKVARIATGAPAHMDNYVDTAGYASCAYELAMKRKEKA